ncbi:ribosome biogenesis protein BOP1 homolog [Pieris rapae]|uniref:ribosome biogenesis protein BOP1 homolog n=1 Tax=Pieris rapae TaxID=64459 RepID=UPI001E27AD83|nr:ribosome biogenesis protein BOP1 homolog [Pieris rapae]
MPPFRTGLLKRKIEFDGAIKPCGNITQEENENSDVGEDLLIGELDNEDDGTDSEHESDEKSDTEQDKVLFENDVDSLLGDNNSGHSTDESSELTDSENDSDEESSHKTIESEDSGSESVGPMLGSSDDIQDRKKELDKKKELRKKKMTNQIKSKVSDSIQKLSNEIHSNVTSQPVQQKDEYDSGDTSDEEERVNTAGDVPSWWYDEFPHLGYDLDGRRIARPQRRDLIDDFLRKCEDPEFWRTVKDPSTGQDVILSKDDLKLIERIRNGNVPSETHDEYEPWTDWFTREVLATPLRAFPEHKRSFLPSRSEQMQVARLVHALKMGWSQTRREIAARRRAARARAFYDLWGSDDVVPRRAAPRHLPAPRRPPPAHAESYNPPPEYLLDRKEMKEWEKLRETPWKRKYTFLPTRHASLREVPAYERFTRERFLRCLDLYLAPRALKMRLTIRADDLVPRLPSPRDLQPFPTAEVLRFTGHDGLVRSVDFDPAGQYALTAGEDGTVRVWEVASGRCLRTLALGEPAAVARWTPVGGLSLVAAAAGARLLLLNPGADVGAHRVAERTDRLLRDAPPAHDVQMDERTRAAVKWEDVDDASWARGVRLSVRHLGPLAHLAWHARGDYLAATVRDGGARAVLVHQVSRRRSQLPFRTAKGLVQCAVFHPREPRLLVATQRAVRVYDLVKQQLVRKLLTGAQWVSSVAVHPGGDNVLVGSYDRKLVWFDLELSGEPYQTLRLHGGAVRAVAFHPRYPLFASAGDDERIVVSHGMVYQELTQNPLLVPLKQLRGPERREDLCVLDLRFHPTQPWLAAAGADGTVRLYS